MKTLDKVNENIEKSNVVLGELRGLINRLARIMVAVNIVNILTLIVLVVLIVR